MKTIRQRIKELFELLFPMNNIQTPQGRILCEVAYKNVNKDLSPKEDAFGCAETVFTLLHLAFGDGYKTTSTRVAYEHFLVSPYYVVVSDPLPGDIVISPTGRGNGRIANGHMGIVGYKEEILSNNSYNSKLEINYDIESWNKRYGVVGGYPVVFFRRIS